LPGGHDEKALGVTALDAMAPNTDTPFFLEIGQLSGYLFAVGIEARKPLADLRLLCADLVSIVDVVVGMVTFSSLASIGLINLVAV
jgi:hypothetical protein